ncbi:anti-sigma factor family protein [Paenibacillus thermotolerans]|uniref:anti-sigma factor family protein n=1 Tax=Paenibacillus thermotolerans TaxID=3027807 RepID=UPI0023684DCB|nr:MULTISPECIES: zf-HC2 domain-containing protein [unclassified Paenibacillus]
MSCEEVVEFMQRHLDHDLNEEETKRMREHAEGCAECSDMLRRLELLNEDLENLPKVTPAFSIVDSILPKLQEIDAAANAADEAQAAARQEHESEIAPVPMRRTRRTFRTPAWTAGGIAAAAVLLGVMIFNGLPETFKEQSSGSMEDTASSAEASLFAAADTAADELAASKESAQTEEAADANEAPVATGSAELPKAAEEPGEPVKVKEPDDTGSDTAPPAPSDSNGDRFDKIGKAQIATIPNDGSGEGVSGSSGTADDREAAPESQPIDERGDVFGIAAMPEEPESESVPPAELQDGASNRNKGFAAVREPDHSKSLANEDGSLVATVQPRKDSSFIVVVATPEGAIVFSSEKVWPSGTEIRFNEWSGAIVSYTVVMADGEHTFSIDVSAGTEDQLAR